MLRLIAIAFILFEKSVMAVLTLLLSFGLSILNKELSKY